MIAGVLARGGEMVGDDIERLDDQVRPMALAA
jgi:hypothetical protein